MAVYDDDADKKFSNVDDDGRMRTLGDNKGSLSSSGAPQPGSVVQPSGSETAGSKAEVDSGESADKKSLSPNEIKNAEEEPASDDAPAEKSSSSPETKWITNLKNKTGKKKGGKKKAGIAALIGGAGGLIVLAGFAIFMIAALKIPHFAENVTAWQFARTARGLRRSISNVDNERFRMSNVDDAEYGRIKSRYQSVRGATWGKMDKYRPKQVLNNMGAEGRIKYNYTEPEGFWKRERLRSITIDGNEIDVPSKSRFHPLRWRNDLRTFNAKLDANLDKALSGHKSLVRGKVGNAIRESIGLKKLRWWNKKGKDFKGKTAVEADRLQTRQAYGEISDGEVRDGKIQAVQEAADEADEALDDAVADDDMLDDLIRNGGDSSEIISESIDDVLDDPTRAANTGATVAGTLSTVYAIAAPVCTIIEGSMVNSGELIDENMAATQKTYYMYASAGDQQKAGDTTAEAVGAMGRQLDDVADSAPLARASGKTGAAIKPEQQNLQASAYEEYSVLSLLPTDNGFIKMAVDNSENLCKGIADWRVGLGVGVAEVGVTVFSCFFSAGATCGIKAGADAAAKVTIRQVVRQVATNFSVKKFATRFALEAGGVGAATMIARFLALSKMDGQINGLAQGHDSAEQADMGGNAHGNEMNRQMLYGRPMTNSEIAYDMGETRQYLAQKKQDYSIFQRYFSLAQYDSLASTVGMSVVSKPNKLGAFLSTVSPSSVLNNLSSSFTGSFGGNAKALAAETVSANEVNYNIVQWGWSAEEADLMENDESYLPLENDYVLEQSGRASDIESKYKKCYEDTLGTLLSDSHVQRNEDGSLNNKGDCSPSELGLANDAYGENMVFRWRLSKMYANTLDHLDGLQNPKDDKNSTAGSGSSSTAVTFDANGLPDSPIPESETAVTTGGGGIRVFKGIVGAVDSMLSAAEADGIQLSGGGWRDNQQQINLRIQNGCPGSLIYDRSCKGSPETAIPGSSKHERGLAIDFRCNGGSLNSHSSPCFTWLAANAAKFGFKNLPSEPWHWSVDGT